MANSNNIFKCTEQSGYYTVAHPVSEQQIIDFAKSIISNRFHHGKPITSPSEANEFLQSKLATRQREIFGVIFLSNKNEIIAYEELFKGTIDQTAVYPREILKRTLFHNASAVVLSHNHPSGHPQPSQSDISITKKIKEALDLIDVRTLDHIIVAGNNSQSLAELGYI